jgi:ankyrin repeat protein
VAKLLVERGTDVNAKDIYGGSALNLACKHTELVAYLRTMGATGC